MLGHLKKKSEEVLHENPWWTYKKDTFEKPDGSEGGYFYGETLGSVIIIPKLPDGRLLLVLQHRYLIDKQSIEFPCGYIDANETPTDAAIRELREETGYQTTSISKIAVFEPSPGRFRSTTHVFCTTLSEQPGLQELDDTESIEILTRFPDEFDEMVRRNEIWDGYTLAAWSIGRLTLFPEGFSTFSSRV